MEDRDTTKNEENPTNQQLNREHIDDSKKQNQLNNENIYDQYQKENSQEKENKNNEKENKEQLNDNPEKQNSTEKSKRHRRGKNEINERNYRCPDCDKCYLSGPALTTHRKTKHNYGNNGEKRNRGRPKKESQNENAQINPKIKFDSFFNDEKRRPNSLDHTLNKKLINIDIIKEFLQKIFNQWKNELFSEKENVQQYSFYELFISNWEIKNPFPNPECYSSLNREPSIKLNSYNLDELFFFYLKEFSEKTNKDYFLFMIKFIVLFRECVNSLRNNLIKNEDKSENKQLYSQIYNAETIPEICNDFFVEFMEGHQFFGLNKEELIELIQHFCYWLYSKQYTQSHLTLLDS